MSVFSAISGQESPSRTYSARPDYPQDADFSSTFHKPTLAQALQHEQKEITPMINGINTTPATPPAQTQDSARKVLRMVKNERMGGFVPVWETAKNNESSSIEASLSNTATAAPTASETALGYSAAGIGNATQTSATPQEFGFADLLDMVNPLQHVPVLSHIYRELTGDQIKPISQVIGGAVFGGPLGAASGLVNVVIEHETGKDVTGNAVAFALRGETPRYQNQGPAATAEPEIRLAAAQAATNPASAQTQNTPAAQTQDIPGNLLAFVNMKEQPGIVIERVASPGARTAGNITRIAYPELDKTPLHIREPITQVRLSQHFND